MAIKKTGRLLSLYRKEKKTSTPSVSSRIDSLGGEMTELKVYSKVSALNSMYLPSIARELNLIRQNIFNLTKTQTGGGVNTTDNFFEKAKEREIEYESQFKKTIAPTNVTTTKPTPIGKPQESNKGFFGGILDFFKGILGTFLKGAGLGALIAGIGKILEDPETRTIIKNFLVGAFTSIFNGLKEIIKISGEALSDPKTIDAIVNVGAELFQQLKNIISNVLEKEVETPLGKFSIGGILATTVAAFAGFKLALIALEASIAGAAARIAAGGAAGAGAAGAAGGLRRKILSVAARALPYALIGGALYYINKETGEATPAPPGTQIPSDAKELRNEDFQTAPQETATKTSPNNLTTTEKVAATSALATGGAMAASTAAKNIPRLVTSTRDAVLDAKTISVQQLQKSTPTTKWQRFLQFLATKNNKLFKRVGLKLAQATALASLPLAGWIGAAVNLGLAAYTMYEIYELWREFNKIEGTPLPPEEISPGVDLISPEFGGTNIDPVQEESPKPIRVGRAGQVTVNPVSKPPSPMKTTAAEFQKSDKDTRTITSPKPGEYGQEQRFPLQPEPSESLIQFIKNKEGFSPKAKWDYQQYSNGYGTKANSPDEVIDEKEADARARKHISEVYKGVLDYTEKKGYKFNQNQIEALTSFSYNFGLGRLNQLTDNGKRDAETISAKMVEYVNVRKKNKETGSEELVPEKGLLARRTEEQALFNAPVNVASLDIPQTRSITPKISPVTPIAAAPAMPSSIQAAIKSDGTKLGAATIEVAQARVQIGSAPIVVSPPTVNVQAPQVQASMGSMGSASSVVDSEFMKLLVGRTVTL